MTHETERWRAPTREVDFGPSCSQGLRATAEKLFGEVETTFIPKLGVVAALEALGFTIVEDKDNLVVLEKDDAVPTITLQYQHGSEKLVGIKNPSDKLERARQMLVKWKLRKEKPVPTANKTRIQVHRDHAGNVPFYPRLRTENDGTVLSVTFLPDSRYVFFGDVASNVSTHGIIEQLVNKLKLKTESKDLGDDRVVTLPNPTWVDFPDPGMMREQPELMLQSEVPGVLADFLTQVASRTGEPIEDLLQEIIETLQSKPSD